MWDNLGRSIGEMPHWQNMDSKKFFEKVIINDCSNGSFVSSKAHLYLSGHYGNWELFPKLLEEYNLKPALVYRPANNPYVDKLINQSRAKKGISLIKKGKNGIREIITRLQNSGSIGMLIDQKTNDGIEVPFFGFMVKTTPAPANLALKFKAEIILTCVRRVKGANYSINIFPPLQITDDDNTLSIMHEINQNLEKWIREDPSQWFWVHKRWPKEWYKD
jgi:KDO2-lipid IV(A) lauroyltransferase